MSKQSFDYAIVGAGAAGLHLAIQLASDRAFASKRILIVDPDDKVANDRTWSFWEKGYSNWDEIASKKWKKALFYSSEDKFDLFLKKYTYKTIRSGDFYAYCKEKIKTSGQFEWIQDEITEIRGQNIIGIKDRYRAVHVFDSRIPKSFSEEKDKYPSLVQHFVGWIIETPTPFFDEDEIIIMDYRLKWRNQTSFHYILPFSPTTALVEFTLFNEHLLKKEEYEETLNSYLTKILKIEEFRILEKEIGQIPMSTYPFQNHHEQHITKIGTAGGWVRPSSGYSFKNAERYSQRIIENLKKGCVPHKGVAINRFRFYDKIFLGVLKEQNNLGEKIFQTLYTQHSIPLLFRFLDEESTISEDLRIMFSLNLPVFRKMLIKTIRNR